MANTVKLKKYSDVIEEYVAGGAITPGNLVKFNSNGKTVVHDVVGGNIFPMFALENELVGEGISDDYASGDPVQCWIPYRGDHVNALLSGDAVSKADFLMSAGDGSLKKYAAQLAYAVLSYTDADDDGIKFTARQAGEAGNNIAIVFASGGTAGSESVAVSDNVITVTIEDGVSTYDQIMTAIQADNEANGLVAVEGLGTSSNAAGTLTETSLSGGDEASPNAIVAQALEDKDPSGSTVRVEARIV